MMRGRAALAAAAFVFAACAGCTRVGTQSGPRSANPWTKAGVLRIVNLSEPDTLDPIVGAEAIDSDLVQFWGGLLFNWSDRNEFVPELATVEPTLRNGGISADGKTIVYHLRRGVRWQDGAAFTAADVIFTWHAIINKKNNVPSTVGYDLISSIDERDDHTIAVHLRHAYSPFVATFFAPAAESFPVLPKHLLGRYADINRVPFNERPVGTGPFEVERWQRGNKIVFLANPHYWRGAPKLREIWYTPVPNENTIVTLLQSHEADLEYRASASNFAQLAHLPGYRTRLTPFTLYAQIAFNVRTSELADPRVRRALWYATDTAAVVRDVTHGVDLPGHTDQPPFSWAYDPRARHYDFSPPRARALLDAAGWKPGPDGVRAKNGRRLSLTFAGTSGSATGDAVAIFVQRNWRDVGVDVQVKNYTSSLMFASYGAGGILQGGKFDVGFFSWTNGTDPDDSQLWMCDQIPPAGQNVYRYCNPALDAQERIALASSDRAVRIAAYAKIQRILADDVPAIILWYERRISVENDDLQEYRPAHAVTSFWNPYEWSI